jgi:hypothetical protein
MENLSNFILNLILMTIRKHPIPDRGQLDILLHVKKSTAFSDQLFYFSFVCKQFGE